MRLQPRAKRTEVVGEHGDALLIRVTAPPVDGRANDALLALVANLAGVPKSAVTLKYATTSRDKVVQVQGIAEEALKDALMRSR